MTGPRLERPTCAIALNRNNFSYFDIEDFLNNRKLNEEPNHARDDHHQHPRP
jgi:hypothetical protein